MNNVIDLLEYSRTHIGEHEPVTAEYHAPETCSELQFDLDVPDETFADWQEMGI